MNSQNQNDTNNETPVDYVFLNKNYSIDLSGIKNKRIRLILEMLMIYGLKNGIYDGNNDNDVKKINEYIRAINTRTDEQYYDNVGEDEIENTDIAKALMIRCALCANNPQKYEQDERDEDKITVVKQKQNNQTQKIMVDFYKKNKIETKITPPSNNDENGKIEISLNETKKNAKTLFEELFNDVKTRYGYNSEMSAILNQIDAIIKMENNTNDQKEQKKEALTKMVDQIANSRFEFYEQTNKTQDVILTYGQYEKYKDSSKEKKQESKNFLIKIKATGLPEFTKDEILEASSNVIKCKSNSNGTEYTIFPKFNSYISKDKDGVINFYENGNLIMSDGHETKIDGENVIQFGDMKTSNGKGLIVRIEPSKYAGQTTRTSQEVQIKTDCDYDKSSIKRCVRKVCDKEGNIIAINCKYNVNNPLVIASFSKEVFEVKMNDRIIEREDKAKEIIQKLALLHTDGIADIKQLTYLNALEGEDKTITRSLANLYIKQHDNETIDVRKKKKEEEIEKEIEKKEALRREKERYEKNRNDINNDNYHEKNISNQEKNCLQSYVSILAEPLPKEPILETVNDNDISAVKRFFENLLNLFGVKTTLEKRQEQALSIYRYQEEQFKYAYEKAIMNKNDVARAINESYKSGKISLTKDEVNKLNEYCKAYNLQYTVQSNDQTEESNVDEKNKMIGLNQNNNRIGPNRV